ncbi:MAG TPA: TolC family protein, partial [Gemmatimonadales bacterium]|nr:TolC family protein [Gemmatimonadales bacterium]
MRSAISGAARFLSLFCALACLLQGTAQAQGMDSLMSSARAALRRGVLTLGEVYRRLDAANPELAASRARTRAAEARIASVRRPPDPQLQFGLMNRMLPGFGLADPLGMNQVQVMQMLPFPGKLRLAGRVAAGRAEAEDARADDMGWDVRSRAAMAYYDAYAMDRSLVVAQTTLRIVRDLAEIARTMYAVGEGRQADVLRAQVEIARMEEEITRMSVDRYAAVVR